MNFGTKFLEGGSSVRIGSGRPEFSQIHTTAKTSAPMNGMFSRFSAPGELNILNMFSGFSRISALNILNTQSWQTFICLYSQGSHPP